jgi:outer membrane protein
MIRKIASVSVIALTLSLTSAISSVDAQSIEDAMAKAYINNPTLLAARAGLRSTDEGVPQALANWRPTVEITSSAGAQVQRGNTNRDNRSQSRRPVDFGISLTQPLFRGGRTLAATSGAENNVRAARANMLDSEQNILLQAATAYLNVFRDQAVLELNRNNEEVLQRQLEATRDRFEVGEITRTDVHQAEARLARSVADRIQSEGDLETSRANYLNIVGEPAESKAQLPETEPVGLPADGEDAVRVAVVNNPGVISAEFSRRSSMDNVDEVWGALLPELNLNASSTREFESVSETSVRNTHEITLDLTIPIYQQGDVYSRLREARQDAAESTLEIDVQRRDAAEQATQAYESLLTARAQVQAFETQIEANVVALEGVQREAAVGSRTVLDILDAEQELLNARVSHVRSQRDQFVAIYELLSALGRLTAKDMGLTVDLYDPREHYDEVRDKWFGGKSTGGVN